MAQKSRTGIIVAIIGGVAIIGAALYLRSRRMLKTSNGMTLDTEQGRIFVESENSGIRPTVPPSGEKLPEVIAQQNQERPSYGILTGIENPQLRGYVASLLDSSQAEKLQGWITLIRQQRAQDSTRWKIGEGFTSLNASDVAHGLYQMNQQGLFNWTGTVRDNIISLQ
jgi:hypothetical protein